MTESTVQIVSDPIRTHYYNALLKKISELEKIVNAKTTTTKAVHKNTEVSKMLVEAKSFRDYFNIKANGAVFTLTRSDVSLLAHVLAYTG